MFRHRNNRIRPAKPEVSYRHEFKYAVDSLQVEILRSRLTEIMAPDAHVGGTGVYQVRSLYFDDFYNSCYYENEHGTDPREKFRIRIYNGSDARISLELKQKKYGMTHKKSCPMTRGQVEDLIAGKPLAWDDDAPPLMKKFLLWLETRHGEPKVIVNYDRIPFVCPDGNVRVTLDTNIMSSGIPEDFFLPDFRGRPIMPTGRHLMEVKFDEFLPDHISRTLQTEGLSRVTFSKYQLCRKIGGIL